MCVLCSTGCGLDVGVAGGRIVGVRGRAGDRVNHGRLGPKGLHGWEANAQPRPADDARSSGEGAGWSRPRWDEAMDAHRRAVEAAIEDVRAGSHGFYNSGQLFLEEYYTLAVVAEAGIGTAHVDGNTRLCTATAATALIESFGTDGAPARTRTST